MSHSTPLYGVLVLILFGGSLAYFKDMLDKERDREREEAEAVRRGER